MRYIIFGLSRYAPLLDDFRKRFRLVAGEAPAPSGDGVRLNC